MEFTDWINLTQGSNQWRAIATAVTNMTPSIGRTSFHHVTAFSRAVSHGLWSFLATIFASLVTPAMLGQQTQLTETSPAPPHQTGSTQLTYSRPTAGPSGQRHYWRCGLRGRLLAHNCTARGAAGLVDCGLCGDVYGIGRIRRARDSAVGEALCRKVAGSTADVTECYRFP
jgi:hypothetical protein